MTIRNLFERAKHWKCYKQMKSEGIAIYGICGTPVSKMLDCLHCPYCIINIPTTNNRERHTQEFIKTRKTDSRGKCSKEGEYYL